MRALYDRLRWAMSRPVSVGDILLIGAVSLFCQVVLVAESVMPREHGAGVFSGTLTFTLLLAIYGLWCACWYRFVDLVRDWWRARR